MGTCVHACHASGLGFSRVERPDRSIDRIIVAVIVADSSVVIGMRATTTVRRGVWCARRRGERAVTRSRAVVVAAIAVVVASSSTSSVGGTPLSPSHRREGIGRRHRVRSTYGARAVRANAHVMASYPAPIVVEPRDGSPATSACIVLHGLGDTGRGWAGAATQIATPRGEKVRWIFPTAKTVPVTLNGGMRMTAWFDLNALDEGSIVDDRVMIEESARYVDALVREQMEAGIPSEKIIVGGFSQGGAIALTASLRSEVKLGGCLALSTYLPLRGDYPDKFGPHARALKIFQGHGTHDMVLQYAYGQKAYELLKEKGIDVEFKTYAGMAHSACAEEFDDVADFFTRTLAA